MVNERSMVGRRVKSRNSVVKEEARVYFIHEFVVQIVDIVGFL